MERAVPPPYMSLHASYSLFPLCQLTGAVRSTAVLTGSQQHKQHQFWVLKNCLTGRKNLSITSASCIIQYVPPNNLYQPTHMVTSLTRNVTDSFPRTYGGKNTRGWKNWKDTNICFKQSYILLFSYILLSRAMQRLIKEQEGAWVI